MTTLELLQSLAAAGRVVELSYHPDADPGDGTTYGTLAACEGRMRGEVGA